MKKKQAQLGLSIIEIMIAMAISAVVIAAVVQVFLSNRQAYNLNESLARSQENGRFAVDIIGNMLRQSGNYGCVSESIPTLQNVLTHTDAIGNTNPIQTTTTINFPMSQDGVDGGNTAFDAPDSITILFPKSNTATVDWTVKPAANAANRTLTLNNGGTFQPGDLVMVSNCQFTDYIALKSGSTNNRLVDNDNALRTDFFLRQDLPSFVTEVEMTHLYVEDEILKARRLFKTDSGINVQEDELLPGVENIQFVYGVDTDVRQDFVVDYFGDITAVMAAGHEDGIIAVRMSLLTVSGGNDTAQNITSEPQTIDFGGQELAMADRRLRKVFETTISLRNRMD